MGNIFGTEKEVIVEVPVEVPVEIPYEDGQEGEVCYELDETTGKPLEKRCQKGLMCAPQAGICTGSCPHVCQPIDDDDVPEITKPEEYECREWIKNPTDFFDNVYKSITLN